jgi:hypothetical protein
MTAAVNYPEGRKSLMSHWEKGGKALFRPHSLLSSGTEIDISPPLFAHFKHSNGTKQYSLISAARTQK